MNTMKETGFSLVELMVALSIGVFLLGGALTVYANSRSSLETAEKLSLLQDNARYALNVIEPDLRSAGFWGMTNQTEFVDGRAGAGDPIAFVVTDDCENNWSVNLDLPVDGDNALNPFPASCLSAAGSHLAGTDTLILRHAADAVVATADLQDGILYVRSDQERGQIFTGTAEPGGFSADAQNFELVTHAYYVGPDSDTMLGLPSLRRLTLIDGGATPAVVDMEILPGVEDFQVQFGVDTDADGSANSYVNPSAAVDLSQVLSVRIWLRLRAERPEDGYQDITRYVYADQDFDPSGTADATDDPLRRLLVSKTIGLRNRLVAVANGS